MNTQGTREVVDNFFTLLEEGKHEEAAQVLADLCANEQRELAGYMLARATGKTVSVTQTAGNIEAGSTVIGYRG